MMPKQQNKTIVLFDLDGTLTEARKEIDLSLLVEPLEKLIRVSEIGILTGSGLNYVQEQAAPLFPFHRLMEKMHILPCNGTEYFAPIMKLTHSTDMSEKLGELKFESLMKNIIELQLQCIEKFDIPLTGHFVDFRGSMINWCPIGRNASQEQRNRFKEMDKSLGIREEFLSLLRKEIENNKIEGITAVLGGNTSFDIYPDNWDKTYALQHFEDYDVYFVGDRCEENGNDYEVCKALGERCFAVKSPEDTAKLINETLLPMLTDCPDCN
tara:strand:- start:5804 stop:6607 length:804 start_codon:yes stop_codon:yes gene_type:complete